MPCCSAINCCNRSEQGFRMFRFPTKIGKRYGIWIHNMRRGGKWIASQNSYLCEKHFEKSQFETGRADGWRKLKPNAVPTIFDVPNPPPLLSPPPRGSLYKIDNQQSSVKRNSPQEVIHLTIEDLQAENAKLREESLELRLAVNDLLQQNQQLRSELESLKRATELLFSKDQMKMLLGNRVSQWSNEDIIKGLKFRFALSVKGFEFLRGTGYPLPSYSTLMRRIQDLHITFGVFHDVLQLLKFKASTMDPTDLYCVASWDEMVIAEKLDYDKSIGSFVGHVTMGNDKSLVCQKLFLLVVRGVKNRWKQIIACHVTRKETIDVEIVKKCILDCIHSVESCGLKVIAFSSDLDSRNKSFYTSLGIRALHSVCVNSFEFNGHKIFCMPDICHLMKNLKSALLSQTAHLPENYVQQHNLGSHKIVSGAYVVELWNFELSNGMEKRLLHHLRREDVEPLNFDKMNVGAAVRFFSPKTASAIKTAIRNGILPEEAVATAEFIVTIYQWFTIVNSQLRKTSITLRNRDVKFIFLHSVIKLFQGIVFTKGWKPLNYGFVVATMSFCDIAEFLFLQDFDFILGHRFTQDATENIFSQLRNKEGRMPTALQSLRGIKNVTVSQFVSDVQNTSYLCDSDEFLLDYCKTKKNYSDLTEAYEVEETNFQIETFSLYDFSTEVSAYDTNSLFYIAGSTTLAMGKRVCSECVAFLYCDNLPNDELVRNAKMYTDEANQGGLRYPCVETFLLILHCELYFQGFSDYLQEDTNTRLIQSLIEHVDISFLTCCNVKEKIVRHFFNVRSFCKVSFIADSKKRCAQYGSASLKKV